MKKFAEHRHGRVHIDFNETNAIPEIHVSEDEPEVEQRKEEEEGRIHIIKEGVAVPEVMREQ